MTTVALTATQNAIAGLRDLVVLYLVYRTNLNPGCHTPSLQFNQKKKNKKQKKNNLHKASESG